MRHPNLATWLAPFLEPKEVRAKMMVQDTEVEVSESGVEIVYKFPHMELHNLADLYPYVRLPLLSNVETSRNSRERIQIDVSDDRENWSHIENREEESEFQIFEVLNPAFILPLAEFEEPSTENPFSLTGKYSIRNLGLPKSVILHFTEHEESLRDVLVTTDGSRILQMVQKDFPPFKERIKLLFEY